MLTIKLCPIDGPHMKEKGLHLMLPEIDTLDTALEDANATGYDTIWVHLEYDAATSSYDIPRTLLSFLFGLKLSPNLCRIGVLYVR